MLFCLPSTKLRKNESKTEYCPAEELGLIRLTRHFLLYLFVIKLQDFAPEEIEHEERCRKADDAADADIREEMLGKVDT